MARRTDKVALVTGAAGGIGQAMMQRLAREGAHIVAEKRYLTTLFRISIRDLMKLFELSNQ